MVVVVVVVEKSVMGEGEAYGCKIGPLGGTFNLLVDRASTHGVLPDKLR